MSNNTFKIDRGSIARISNSDTSISPLVQILDIKRIQTSNAGERYRLVISDGISFIQGMLATQLSYLVKQDKLKKYTIIQLTEFVTNTINGKRICVVIKCKPTQHPGQKIGNPIAINSNNNSNNNNNNNNNNISNNYPNNNNNNRVPPPSNDFQNRNNNNNSFLNNNNNNNNMNRQEFYRPISSLNPYQSGWKIKARCTGKDNMRHYSNQRGAGKVFSVDLLDKEGGEIRATMFNDAAEKFFAIFEKDKVYSISKGQVKIARKGYTHIKNDYSITLSIDSEVIQLQDDNDIKNANYNFINITTLNDVNPNEYADVIGIVTQISEPRQIISTKTQKELTARSITLSDKSGCVECTLWGDEARNFVEKDNIGIVLAIKGARVSAYGGRSLNPGTIEISPEDPKSIELKMWWEKNKNNNLNQNKLTQRLGISTKRHTFSEVIDLKLGLNADIDPNTGKQKAEWFSVLGTISSIAYSPEKKPWYLSVNPDEETNEKYQKFKVVPQGDGSYACDKNNKVYNSFLPRYILRFCASDFSGNLWLTAFDEPAQTILNGVSATTANEYLESSDINQFNKIFKDATFKRYVFKCRARNEKYEDRSRVKYDVHSLQLADIVTESKALITKIKQLRALSSN